MDRHECYDRRQLDEANEGDEFMAGNERKIIVDADAGEYYHKMRKRKARKKTAEPDPVDGVQDEVADAASLPNDETWSMYQ